MKIKLSKDDFVKIYDLRCVGFLRKRGFKSILVARNKDTSEVFSMYLKEYKLMKVLVEFNEIEAERLARIEFYEKRNKKFSDGKVAI